MIKASKHADYYYVMLNSCSASVLKYLLHPDGDYIWLYRHMPDTIIQWWNANVPVSPGDVIEGARIRNLEYDVEFKLDDFLRHLDRFEDHGMFLTQLRKPVPNGLSISSLPEDRLQHILIQNGMVAQFDLPHACEVAQFSCSDLQHLERVIEIPEIKNLLLE